MQIYFSPSSPYVRKCLVAAHELGLNGRIELLASNANPVQRDAHIIEKNPLGTVPTFLTDEGQVLFDSRVICEYLNDLAGGKLFPSGPARWQALTLGSLGDGMLDASLLARYEDVSRPDALRWPEWRAAQLNKVETSLAYLEAKPSLLSGHMDIGTLTMGCALWYLELRFAEVVWRNRFPNVAKWYGELSQRPSMQAVWAL